VNVHISAFKKQRFI
jgi:hypothetical protein